MEPIPKANDLGHGHDGADGSRPATLEETLRPEGVFLIRPTVGKEARSTTPQSIEGLLGSHPNPYKSTSHQSSLDSDHSHHEVDPSHERPHVQEVPIEAETHAMVPKPSESTDRVAYYERHVFSSQSEKRKQRLSEEEFNNPQIYNNPLVLEMIRHTVHAKDVENKEWVIEGIEAEKMRIYSPYLLKILPDIVGYYPSYSLRGVNDPSRGPIPYLELSKPYRMLSGIREDISQFSKNYERRAEHLRQNIADAPSGDEVASKHAKLEEYTTTVQHIQLLEKELDKLNGPIQQEKMHHQQLHAASFDMLWLLFRPGTLVVTKVAGEPACARVYLPIWSGSEPNTISYLDLKVWYLDFDGMKLRRREHTVRINRYDGLQRIDKLAAYPAKGFAETGLLESLCNRGKRYWACLQNAAIPRTYEGMMVDVAQVEREKMSGLFMVFPKERSDTAIQTHSPSKQEHYDGHVMIDPVLYAKEFGEPRGKAQWLDETDIRMGSEMETELQEFADIDPRTAPGTSFSDMHYQLMPQWIRGFAVGTRKWMCFDVALLKDYKPDATLIDSLILENDNLDLIKAVASRGSTRPENNQRPWQQFRAERVGGKGEGRIILMHGPPGTGKTFAAECVAEWMGRPLLRLTCGELGLDPTRMERKLWQWFRMGEAWGSPLLIDEADVYVSARKPQHGGSLEQNTIVAVFLRTVEYYRGLLFLTTNAVLRLDPAVISRVSIVVHFKAFDLDHRRQLVDRTMKRFCDEYHCDFMSAAKEKIDKEIVGSDGAGETIWNGREIINAFQIMIAIAANENSNEKGISIPEPYVNRAVKNVREFHDYHQARFDSTRDEKARDDGIY